jgi:hypothetical protein
MRDIQFHFAQHKRVEQLLFTAVPRGTGWCIKILKNGRRRYVGEFGHRHEALSAAGQLAQQSGGELLP